MSKVRIAAASLALLTGAATLDAQTAYPRVFTPGDQSDYAPPVDIWLDATRYDYGDRIRPSFTTEPGAYVTIVRVSTDGELRVLYPLRPGLQAPYRFDALPDDRIPWSSSEASTLHESRGTGFVFAIASYERFDFRYYTTGGSWSIARLVGTGRNTDPFEILRRFLVQTLDDRAEYSMDYATYEVESSRQRSRYASRYGRYGYDDYYDLCMTAFGLRYTSYCRSYSGGYYGPYVVVSQPRAHSPGPGSHKQFHLRPLTPDPLMTRSSSREPALEGRLESTDYRERAASARREQMTRDVRPRIDVRSEPRSEPRRVEPSRTEPSHFEPSRADPPRAEPRAQPSPRVEVRAEPRVQATTRTEPARSERPQRDNRGHQ